jgi:quinol monooxygenase YgiN
MNDHATVVRVARYYPSEGRRDEVAGMLKALAESARDAPGCFGAQVTSSDEDTGAVIVVSRWENRDALRRFGDRPENAGVLRDLEPSLTGRPKAEHFTTA